MNFFLNTLRNFDVKIIHPKVYLLLNTEALTKITLDRYSPYKTHPYLYDNHPPSPNPGPLD